MTNQPDLEELKKEISDIVIAIYPDEESIEKAIEELLSLFSEFSAEREKKLLDTLYWMYAQYCSGGHMFMGAGEDASEILENAGYIKVDGVGAITKDNGDSVEQRLEQLQQPEGDKK